MSDLTERARRHVRVVHGKVEKSYTDADSAALIDELVAEIERLREELSKIRREVLLGMSPFEIKARIDDCLEGTEKKGKSDDDPK